MDKNTGMKVLALVLILTGWTNRSLNAQNTSGIISYERHTYWINIMSKMPHLSREEVDRMRLTWGNNDGSYGEKYILSFNPAESTYTMAEQENNFGYSWKQDDFLLYRNFKNGEMRDMINFVGRGFLIEGKIPAVKWKILNEIREIQGYLCMKAETIDPIKDTPVYAWFTDRIPVRGGPEGYGGLPGMILMLEMNTDDVIIEATNVQIQDSGFQVSVPEKMKGKKINREDHIAQVKKYIAESIEGRRNPYWQMRY